MAWILAGFILTECAAYLLHRYLFHGLLWFIHKSHHSYEQHLVEENDVFAIGCAGIGIAVYGIRYFVVHNLMTHKRFSPLRARTRSDFPPAHTWYTTKATTDLARNPLACC